MDRNKSYEGDLQTARWEFKGRTTSFPWQGVKSDLQIDFVHEEMVKDSLSGGSRGKEKIKFQGSVCRCVGLVAYREYSRKP